MAILDSRNEINKLDVHSVLGSIEQLPEQIQDAWEQVKGLALPDGYSSVKNIIVSGMGGSALGAHVIKHLYKDDLQLPLEIYSHYHLPGYVSRDSLVILSSYSGNTEETLAAAKAAELLGAKIIVISSGGELATLAHRSNWPLYQINPRFNPSQEPRMAIGYVLSGLLAIFNKLGIVSLAERDMLNLVDNLRELIKKLAPESNASTAKLLSYAAYDNSVTLVAAEHLIGAVHVTNNQLNENAKVLTAEWSLPEFNHHYLEALSHPHKLQEDVQFLLYNSQLYSPELVRRIDLTRQVIENAGYGCEIIQATAPTKLEQVFEIITLGAYLSFYLAMLYQIDPAPIPRVDWFKSQMKNSVY